MNKYFSLLRFSHKIGSRCYTNPPSPKPPVKNVEGLSKNVLVIQPNPVGPGASKSTDYKNPEYFSYNNISYFEAEVEMLKFRLPQPSSLKN